jgi:hypothetical protein
MARFNRDRDGVKHSTQQAGGADCRVVARVLNANFCHDGETPFEALDSRGLCVPTLLGIPLAM